MLISSFPYLSVFVRICPFSEGQKRVKTIGKGGRRGERRRDRGEWEERTESNFSVFFHCLQFGNKIGREWETMGETNVI